MLFSLDQARTEEREKGEGIAWAEKEAYENLHREIVRQEIKYKIKVCLLEYQ